MAIALILTVWSFADYFWRGRHHFLAAADVSEGVTDVVLIAAAYLAGSLPFGYWLVKLLRHQDIRTLGSHNTGATNVWRNFGWRFGVGTLLLDAAKGALPTLAALHWAGPRSGVDRRRSRRCSGTATPLLLGFGGGKGVATGAGAALVLFPAGVGLAALAWAIIFLTTALCVAGVALGRRGLRGGRDRRSASPGR